MGSRWGGLFELEIEDFSYLVDRLAVGLGNKHGCDRFADNWGLSVVWLSRKRDEGRHEETGPAMESMRFLWRSALALPNVRYGRSVSRTHYVR